MECKPGELAMAAWALAVLGEVKPQTLIYAGCFVPYLTLSRALRHPPEILLWRLETLLSV